MTLYDGRRDMIQIDFIDRKLIWFPLRVVHVPWESRGCAKWCSYTRKAYRTWSLIVPKRTFWSLTCIEPSLVSYKYIIYTINRLNMLVPFSSPFLSFFFFFASLSLSAKAWKDASRFASQKINFVSEYGERIEYNLSGIIYASLRAFYH